MLGLISVGTGALVVFLEIGVVYVAASRRVAAAKRRIQTKVWARHAIGSQRAAHKRRKAVRVPRRIRDSD